MAKAFELQIKPTDLIPSRERMAALAKQVMLAKVNQIRTQGLRRGSGIARYKPATIKKRRLYGLQTAFVDLTGNNRYSRKGWRLLNSWRVIPVSTHKAVVVWSHAAAAQLADIHTRRYKRIF